MSKPRRVLLVAVSWEDFGESAEELVAGGNGLEDFDGAAALIRAARDEDITASEPGAPSSEGP